MRQITMAEALNEALREELKRDEKVFVFGESIGTFDGIYKVTRGLLKEFGPQRVVDTPISENSMAGFVVGAAMTGLRPVLELMYNNFALPALDQIINQGVKHKYITGDQFTMPYTIRIQGGIWSCYGGHHSDSFESIFMHIPGLKVVMPSNPYDAKGLLKSAIRDNNPVIFMEHKRLYFIKGPVPEEEYTLPLGKAEVKREGKDITVIATSVMVNRTLEAADILEKEGISVEVVDPMTLKPLDMDTILKSVKKTNRALVTHESYRTCGFGAEMVSRIVEEAFDYLDAPVRRLTGMEVPAPIARNLEDAVMPKTEDIVAEVRRILK